MKYKPKRSSHGTWITDLTSSKKNSGIDNQKQFKSSVAMIEFASDNYRRPHLIHICFTAGNQEQYQQAIKGYCRSLSNRGVIYSYRGCFEQSDEDTKGYHCHLMLVFQHMDDGISPFTITDTKAGSMLARACSIAKVKFSIARPFNDKYKFKYISNTDYDKFDDAVEWISYIHKSRSKDDVSGVTYFSSRNDEKKYSDWQSQQSR